jgi:hypothetical protein
MRNISAKLLCVNKFLLYGNLSKDKRVAPEKIPMQLHTKSGWFGNG